MEYRLAIILFICYIVVAAGMTLFGPIVPKIREAYGLEYYQVSYIIGVSFLGGFLSFLGGMVISYTGYFKLILIAIFLLCAGFATFPILVPSLLMYFSYFIIGLGSGFFETAVNPVIGKVYGEKKGMLLNLIHIGWNIGAFVGPSLIMLTSILSLNFLYPYYIVALFLLVSVIPLTTVKINIDKVDVEETYSLRKILYERSLIMKFLLVSSVMFLYLGIEQGINVWLPSLLYEYKAPNMLVEISVGLFWGALGIGRLLWSPIVDKIGYSTTIKVSSVLSFFTMLLGLIDVNPGRSIVYWSATGFILAPMFPTIYALCIETCKKHMGLFSGMLFSLGILGSFLLSILIGYVSTIRSVKESFYLILVLSLIIIIALKTMSKDTIRK